MANDWKFRFAPKPFVQKKSPILIQGVDDVMIRFAKCCSPLPGDEIMGFISINIKVNQDKKAVGTLDLEVTGRNQLMACIKELSGVPGVISVDQV